MLVHITAFTGCVGNRACERDHITKLFRAQIPLITSGKKYYFKLGYTHIHTLYILTFCNATVLMKPSVL